MENSKSGALITHNLNFLSGENFYVFALNNIEGFLR